MKVLTDEQRKQALATLQPLLADKEVAGLCAYGSRIAGYSTDKSDYDVIAIVKGFRQRIKYYYLKGEVHCSVLAVDSKSFESDCKRSTLGEFVSGRLLNPFEVLVGGDQFSRGETEYKKKVILEGLMDAISDNQRFTELIKFKLEYFLFEKLRKRAAIYPPVIYSYSLTYSDPLKKRNLADSLVGFKKAAFELALEGYLTFDRENGVVELVPGKLESNFGLKLTSRASYTAKSLAQYAVHGYAGRVGVNVIGRELLSKLSRSQKKYELPGEIRQPRSFWTCSDGKLFPDTADWYLDLLEWLGVDQRNTSVTQKNLGEFYNSTKALTIDTGRKKLLFAVKKYSDVKSVKWVIVNMWSLKNTNFSLSPLERMTREYRALSEFRKHGLSTPAVVALFLSEKILVTEFVRGKNLSDIEQAYFENGSTDLEPIRRFGELLAQVHKAGYCMGDSKPSNVILSDSADELYLVDLEQVHRDGNPVWDLAEFIYYSTMFTLKEERARKIIAQFLEGYQSRTPDKTTIRKAASLRYRAPFQPFMAPNLVNSLRKDLSAS